MAKTPSTMLALGTMAPDFELRDPAGKSFTLSDVRGQKGTLVAFICNHCPFVVHIQDSFVKLCHEFIDQGIGVVAINSNDIDKYPADSPEKMQLMAKGLGFRFPYLYDETQATAQSYHAACTPDFYLFDAADRLVYRGQFDDSRPGNGIAVTGIDLRDAAKQMLNGMAVSGNQKPSIGCNIKWRSGNEPDYFLR
jgi:peroxiredoxin